MRYYILSATTVGILVLFVGFMYEPKVQTIEIKKTTATPQAMLNLVNQERVKRRVAPLVIDERLNQSAQKKANELTSEGWDDTPHVNNAGIHGYEYAHEATPSCTTTSENLLANQPSLHAGIQWWLNSPPHKEAMLGDWTSTGFGISGDYIVEHFCKNP